MKRILITGAAGQDGSYLAERLLSEGHEVHGITRSGRFDTGEFRGELWSMAIEQNMIIHKSDLLDFGPLAALLSRTCFDEIYHLAAPSSVRESFERPVSTTRDILLGTAILLEALVTTGFKGSLVNASSSEMFGVPSAEPQDENTRFGPKSPYGCAKVGAHCLIVNYREAYGLHASNAIMFNHESPRRPRAFVTRKIIRAVAEIEMGLRDEVQLGSLEVRRDWGYAGDFVGALARIAGMQAPSDYVVATGESHTLREFVVEAFSIAGLQWEKYTQFDRSLLRPADVDRIRGNPSRARLVLGWEPKVRFHALVRLMLDEERKRLGNTP